MTKTPVDEGAAGGIAQARRMVTEVPGPRSRELQARRTGAVAPGVSSTLPVYIAEASGAILRDVDGNSLIDLGSGIAVTGIGHAVPAVVAAVSEQVARFTHTCFMVAPYEGYVGVCEQLNALTPGDHAKRSALFNSGAEAVENAVKVARHATGRQAVVVFDHAYHGRTNLTMALTAKNMPYKHRFGPFAPEVYRVPTSLPVPRPGGHERRAGRGSGRSTSSTSRSVPPTSRACSSSRSRARVASSCPPRASSPRSRRGAADNGVLFVADEIQTGFCRTGDWFACEHEGVVPDLVSTAKGIAGRDAARRGRPAGPS